MNDGGAVHFPTSSGYIQHGAALSVASNGSVRPLVAGEKFIGVSAESIATAASILVSPEGFCEFPIEGVTAAHIGAPVFATSSASFTLDGKSQKSTEIGRVVRALGNGRALVKYSF